MAPLCTCRVTTVGEDLCLAYANTRWWRGRPAPQETLTGFDALPAALERLTGMTPLAHLTAWGRANPRRAEAVLAEAVALRETVFRTFTALADRKTVAADDVRWLGAAIAAAPARDRLVQDKKGFAWEIALQPRATDLLAPVLWSAGDLMLNAAQRKFRACANPECLWLFLDRSKAGARRWCDMAACGNRAKARRHHARIREELSP
jgi:predicted RNA-binding Zn ribbon-like protein